VTVCRAPLQAVVCWTESRPVTARLTLVDYLSRRKKLQAALEPARLDGLLLTHLPNIRYICGFTGSSGVLVLSAGKSVFFTDGRYAEQARGEVRTSQVIVSRKPTLTAAAGWLASQGKKLGLKVIGIEGDHLTLAARAQLGKGLSSRLRLRLAPPLVEQARMVKDAEEISCLRAAVLLGSSLFDRALATIRPGLPETAVAAEIEYAARSQGADGMSFETIVAAGKRSALPHGRASRSPIPKTGFVVCDFGVILSGYCSDMTRTVHVGRPSAEACRMYETLRDAQQAALQAVSPGNTVGEVDKAARNALKKKGLAKYFPHSTGHGVGLEIHEPPRLAAAQKEILRPGMVVTVEPGIYISGSGGARIEDMVVVTERGCEVLTPTPKDLITI